MKLIIFISAAKCKPSEFHCKTKTEHIECLPASWQCDETPDCLDGSDEPTTCCMLNFFCTICINLFCAQAEKKCFFSEQKLFK